MPAPRSRRRVRCSLALLLFLALPGLARAWTEGLQAAAEAMALNRATPAQEMMVFVHNKELNLMAQEGLIRDRAYAVCQDEFNRLNKQFVDQAFKNTGFSPDTSDVKLNPGTDTDVNVRSPSGRKVTLEDIESIENNYQAAVRARFKDAPPGRIDTNTDFMPHPSNTDPAEFEKIASHINDVNHGTAYKDPRAATAQSKLGDKAAKITVEEAGSFSAEMKRLANAKLGQADALRADAARLRSSNPGEAARLEAQASQYEYQAAKYHSRMTDINNQMRSQYGLGPKKGAMDDVAEAIAKIGRNPYSAAEARMVRSLHTQALQNSADNMIGTMLEIARKNPASLPQIRQIISAEAKSLSAAGAARAATRLEEAVKQIASAAKWAAFKEAAKDLSGWNATTKVSVVMTAGGALLIGYQGVTIALDNVKATDTVWDFIRESYVHAAWEGTGIGPAFEQAQREELERYRKEFENGNNPSMAKHVTFTLLKTGVYMGRDVLIGLLYLPDTIWELFTQQKEMEAYAAMQNELASAMRQMVLDRQAFDQMMTRMRKLGLHDEDVKPFLNCLCRACGGMFGGYYNPAAKGEYGRGPCVCSGPLTMWKTPLPTGDKDRQYACFNEITKMRYDEARDIFDKWHQQALNENAQAVEQDFAQIRQAIVGGNLENDEELVRRLADQFAAIQPLLRPADVDWGQAMLGPHLVNHARRQAEAGDLPRAVDDMDKALGKVGVRGAQNEANARQWKAQYQAWDPVWREFKAKRLPEVDALLGKRQIQRAIGEIGGIEAQLKDPYSSKLPPAFRDPDFLRLKARVEEQRKLYAQTVADAWKRSTELQKANDPRAAAEVLEQAQKEWEHPPDTVNGLTRQIAYDRGLVARAQELKQQGQALEEAGSMASALERYAQSVAIQRDGALEARLDRLRQAQAQAARSWTEGQALLDGGRAVEALARFKESVGAWPQAENRRYVGQLEEQLTQRKAQAAASWNDGKSLYDAGRVQEALAKFRESVRIWPDAANAQYVQRLESALAQQAAAQQAAAQQAAAQQAAAQQAAAQQAAAQQAAAQQAAAQQAAAQQASAKQAAAQQAAAQQAAAQQAAAQQAAAQLTAAARAAQQAAAQAAVAARPDPTGTWRHHPEATWTVTRTSNGGYYAEETGLGNARGPAHWTASGTFRIDYRTRDGSIDGYYDVRFTADGHSADGEVREITGPRRTASSHWTRVSGAAGAAPMPTSPAATKGGTIFRNGNIGGTSNGPTRPTTISLPQAYVITSIQDYHWNSGRGAQPGSIALRDASGRVHGPWAASGTPGQGGVPNANWTARPNAIVPAGTYTVVDSDPASWSHNAESGGAGFTQIEGYPAGGSAGSAPSSSPVSSPVSATPSSPVSHPRDPPAAAAASGQYRNVIEFRIPESRRGQVGDWQKDKNPIYQTGELTIDGRVIGNFDILQSAEATRVRSVEVVAAPDTSISVGVRLPKTGYPPMVNRIRTVAEDRVWVVWWFIDSMDVQPDRQRKPTSTPTPPAANTSAAPAVATSLKAEFTNRSRQPAHIFVDGQDNFGPQNRLNPGEKRTVSVAGTGVIRFVAGRDGNRLATCRWEGTGIPVVVFDDPANLACMTGVR